MRKKTVNLTEIQKWRKLGRGGSYIKKICVIKKGNKINFKFKYNVMHKIINFNKKLDEIQKYLQCYV